MRAYRGYEQVRTIVPFSMARAGASFAGCGRAQRAGAHTSPGLMRRTQGVPRIERYPHFLGSNGNSLVLGVLRRAIRHFRLRNGGCNGKNEGIAQPGAFSGAAALVLVIYALLHAVPGRGPRISPPPAMENGTIARTCSYPL